MVDCTPDCPASPAHATPCRSEAWKLLFPEPASDTAQARLFEGAPGRLGLQGMRAAQAPGTHASVVCLLPAAWLPGDR